VDSIGDEKHGLSSINQALPITQRGTPLGPESAPRYADLTLIEAMP
jgi:hypothetical protein